MPQLDGLRALAVGAVLVHHFLPLQRFIPDNFVSFGELGVRLFFVLSGFLITGILLKCRIDSDSSNEPRSFKLRQFYVRRFLRIFPVYYLTLAIVVLLNLPTARETIFWHLSYLSNVYFALRGGFEGPLSHFWSLAVEEQFYLIWPWLIIFPPKKYLHSTLIITIILAPLFRLIMHVLWESEVASAILLFGCLDALGLGALLAYYHSERVLEQKAPGFLNFSLYTGILLFAVLLVARVFNTGRWLTLAAMYLATSLLFVWLVGRAAPGFKGWIGKALELRPVVYIGRISYGIYIFHNFMPLIVPKFFGIIGLPYPQGRGASIQQFVILCVATLVFASLSWRFFEGPINSLKRHFQYGKPRHKNEPLSGSVETALDFS